MPLNPDMIEKAALAIAQEFTEHETDTGGHQTLARSILAVLAALQGSTDPLTSEPEASGQEALGADDLTQTLNPNAPQAAPTAA